MPQGAAVLPGAAGLYLHVPFCSAICPYCDFAVQVGNASRRRQFVEGLCREIEQVAPAWHDLKAPGTASPNTTFDSLYFGGGTPSFLEPEELHQLIEALRRHFDWHDAPRIFFEANPEDVDARRLDAWRQMGVDTLTLGVQALDDPSLEFLGRRHRAAEARQAVELARQSGFATLSIDLIYGFPGQRPEDWLATLETAVSLEPDHLSCYELEIHPQTSFGKQFERGILRPMPDAQQAELFKTTHRWLTEHGYAGYEVSNFARSDEHRSQHNQKYWDHTPYLGLGPSAHSFAAGRRWWNERSFGPWQRRLLVDASPRAGEEALTAQDMLLERLMLSLRTRRGVDLDELRKRYDCDVLVLNGDRIDAWQESGLLVHEGGFLRPTLDGWVVADALAAEFELG